MIGNLVEWSWEKTSPRNRITHPGSGKYPPATFYGFFLKEAENFFIRFLSSYQISELNHQPRIFFFRRGGASDERSGEIDSRLGLAVLEATQEHLQ